MRKKARKSVGCPHGWRSVPEAGQPTSDPLDVAMVGGGHLWVSSWLAGPQAGPHWSGVGCPIGVECPLEWSVRVAGRPMLDPLGVPMVVVALGVPIAGGPSP